MEAKDGNVEGIIAIANQWAQELGFEIEIERPDSYLAKDVNNYALHTPDQGWYRKKGIFTRGRGTEPQVIYDAVLAAVGKDLPVEDYILHHDDIFDFLFSHTASKGHVFYGETPLQHTKSLSTVPKRVPPLSVTFMGRMATALNRRIRSPSPIIAASSIDWTAWLSRLI
ncbi:MAG: hypothetical protein ACREYC_23035 [Gammaproteobacteria bacterium]